MSNVNENVAAENNVVASTEAATAAQPAPAPTEAPVAKKRKPMRLKVRRSFKEEFGLSVAAALRFLGRKKVTTEQAVIGLRSLGVKGFSMHTVRTQLYCGKAKKLSHGPMPKVPSDIAERLLKACGVEIPAPATVTTVA